MRSHEIDCGRRILSFRKFQDPFLKPVFVALLMFAISNGASSQTVNEIRAGGRIDGQTRDLAGASVPKTIVRFESETLTREVVSDESGQFQIDLPAATYKVSVQRFGIFDPYQRKNIKVRSGKTKKLDIVLTYDLKKYPPVIATGSES